MAVTMCDTCHSRYVRVSCDSSFLLSVFQSLFWFHPLYVAFQYRVWSSTQWWQPNQSDFVYGLFNDTVNKHILWRSHNDEITLRHICQKVSPSLHDAYLYI